jgi:CheY-like chemotaxis protein
MTPSPITILLVEDDELDVMNVQRAFRQANIANPLHVAQNGLEALEMLKDASQLRPYLRRLIILLDLKMPKMDGIEFLRELRADPELQMIPVVVLTSSDEERDRLAAFRSYVAGYILKPVTTTNFILTMTTLNKYWMLSEFP